MTLNDDDLLPNLNYFGRVVNKVCGQAEGLALP